MHRTPGEFERDIEAAACAGNMLGLAGHVVRPKCMSRSFGRLACLSPLLLLECATMFFIEFALHAILRFRALLLVAMCVLLGAWCSGFLEAARYALPVGAAFQSVKAIDLLGQCMRLSNPTTMPVHRQEITELLVRLPAEIRRTSISDTTLALVSRTPSQTSYSSMLEVCGRRLAQDVGVPFPKNVRLPER